MPQRIAGCAALLAFALCLAVGIAAANTFSTAILRALAAMAGMYVIGLLLGYVAQKVLEENLRRQEADLRNSMKSGPDDR